MILDLGTIADNPNIVVPRQGNCAFGLNTHRDAVGYAVIPFQGVNDFRFGDCRGEPQYCCSPPGNCAFGGKSEPRIHLKNLPEALP